MSIVKDYTEEGSPICPVCERSFCTEDLLNKHYALCHCCETYTIPTNAKPFEAVLFKTQELADFYRKHYGCDVVTVPGWYYWQRCDTPGCHSHYRLAPITELAMEVDRAVYNAERNREAVVDFVKQNKIRCTTLGVFE